MKTNPALSLLLLLSMTVAMLSASGCSSESLSLPPAPPEPSGSALSAGTTVPQEEEPKPPASDLILSGTSPEVYLLHGDIRKKVQLVFAKGQFSLVSGDSQVNLPSSYNLGELELDPHTELHLDLLGGGETSSSSDSPQSSSALLVTVIRPTNKIGSTVEQWVCESAASGQLILRWTLAQEQPVVQSVHLTGDMLRLNMPDYNLLQDFRIGSEDIVRLQASGNPADPLADPQLLIINTPTASNLSDQGSSLGDSWVVKRLVSLSSPPFYAGNLYTIFQFHNGTVTAGTAFFTSYANPAEDDIMDFLLIRKLRLPVNESLFLAVIQGTTSEDPRLFLAAVRKLVHQGLLHENNGFYTL